MITIWRIIKYGFQGFLRNRWLSISTVSIMILTLIVFEGLILFNVFSNSAIDAVKEKVDISVYFKSNVVEDDMLNVKRILETFEEVRFVEYVSRDEALELFKERHSDDDIIAQTLEELDENPLLASLNVKAKELSQYNTIAAYLNSPSLEEMVEKVTYAQNALIINRLKSLVDGMNTAVLALTLFLTFLAIMVTFNTIGLAIFSNKEQIGIMRLVGAANNFIRGPYIVEGIIYGAIGAVVSFLIFLPVVSGISPRLESFIPDFNLATYVNTHLVSLLLYQLLFGVGLGIISSIIAIRRYLKI